MRRKRRDESAAEIRAVPWWVWAVAAAIVWLLGQLLIGISAPAKGTIATIVQTSLLKGVGHFISWVFPVGFLLLAIMAAVRQAREPQRPSAEALSDDYAGVEPGTRVDTTRWSSELLHALEWKRIEQLAAIYFRTLKFRVEEAAPGPDGGIDRAFIWVKPRSRTRLFSARRGEPGRSRSTRFASFWASWQPKASTKGSS